MQLSVWEFWLLNLMKYLRFCMLLFIKNYNELIFNSEVFGYGKPLMNKGDGYVEG